MDESIEVALLGIRDELDRALRFHGPLFHELLTTHFNGAPRLPQESWAAFVAANQNAPSWELWEIEPRGDACHRYFGYASGLQEFTQLSESLLIVLCAHRPELDAHKGHHGMIQLVYDMARSFPTALLRSHIHLWGMTDIPNLLEAGGADEFDRLVDLWSSSNRSPGSYPIHPYCQFLAHNLFTSTIALIDLVMAPENALLIGEELERPLLFDEPTEDDAEDVEIPPFVSLSEITDELTCIFQKKGKWRLIGFAVNEGQLPKTMSDSIGLQRIELLLRAPEKEFRPKDLLYEIRRTTAPSRQEMLDQRAIKDFEATIDHLRKENEALRESGNGPDEIFEAIEQNDQQIAWLSKQLQDATYQGKARIFAKDLLSEKARKAVAKSMRDTLAAIGEQDVELAAYLEEHLEYIHGSWSYRTKGESVKWNF